MSQSSSDKTILHVDANNFYASCECAKDPALRGKPMAVCGDPTRRKGIILAKSYEAKRYDIKTGDTVYQALSKCPNLILVQPDFALYGRYSRALFDLYTQYTDRVECFGMDECWLDVTGSSRLFGSGEEIANQIRSRVKQELGLTVSVGVSFTKVLAKLGSDYRKPDATTVFSRDNFRDIVWGLPVSDMIMVGRRTAQTLRALGVLTIGDLARMPQEVLRRKLGVNGIKLWNAANGIEDEEVLRYVDHVIPESISNGTTTPVDITKEEEILSLITVLADNVATRLRGYGLRALNVYVSAKTREFLPFGGSMRLDSPIGSATEIISSCMEMILALWQEHHRAPLRSITVGVGHLMGANESVQLNLFDETDHQKTTNADLSVDDIRARFGKDIIQRGAACVNTFTSEEIIDESDFRPFKKN